MIAALIEGAADVAMWLAELLIAGQRAWGYLFSPRYRSAVHARWQTVSRLRVYAEVLGGALSVLITAGLLGALVWWLL